MTQVSPRTFALSAASVGSAGLVAAVALGLARLLGPSEFGIYTVVSTVAVSVSGLLTWNVGTALMQQLPLSRLSDASELMATTLISVIATLSTAAVMMVIVVSLWNTPSDVVWRIFALAAATSINTLGDCSLRGRFRFTAAAALRIITSVSYATAAIFLLHRGIRRCLPFIDAFTVTTLCVGACGCWMAGARPTHWSFASARAIYGHGIPVTVSSLMLAALFTADSMLLVHFSGAAAVGVYSVYNGMPKRLAGIIMNDGLGLTLLPSLAVTDTRDALDWIVRHAAPFICGATISFALICTPLCLLAGPSYEFSLFTMLISGAGIAIHCLMLLLGFVLVMEGRRGAKIQMIGILMGFPIALGMMWWIIRLGTPRAGLWAFAAANLVIVGVLVVIGRVGTHSWNTQGEQA